VNIISLLPATTEIIYALGLGDHIAGRSHECDFPEQVKELPVCSEPKYPFSGQSYAIDQKVKAILAEGLSIYRIDSQKIKELHPDLIFTQDQCEVCAVDLQEVEQCLNQIGVDASVLSFSPETLEDILADIKIIADRLKVSERGKKLQANIAYQFTTIKEKTSKQQPVHVEVIEWIDPLMSAGNWMPELIEIAGGYSLLAESGKHSPFIDFEVLRRSDPEVLAIIPCGYSIQQIESELSTLFELEGWDKLRAVQNKRVYMADGHQYFNRPGPRIADSAKILAEIIHPELFKPNHQNQGWVRVE
jgi:iron complex transport system substrate-binding protein